MNWIKAIGSMLLIILCVVGLDFAVTAASPWGFYISMGIVVVVCTCYLAKIFKEIG